MKKRIFLGAYLNSTNAQNLNCLALAQHLNQDKYTLYALKIYASSGNLSTHLPHVKLFYLFLSTQNFSLFGLSLGHLAL